MTRTRTLVSFVDEDRWPTAVRADLLVRAHQLVGERITHHIVTPHGQPLSDAFARLGVAHATLHEEADFADSAQVMVDRLLSRGLAYSGGRRIFLPWTGAPGYSPAERLRGRRNAFDVQLWGPQWEDGPEGPSATLIRWSAILDLADGPADWVFGFDKGTAMRARALAQALGAPDIAAAFEPPLQAAYWFRDPESWSGAQVRWTALQVKHDLRTAQAEHALHRANLLRKLPRSMRDRPIGPERATLLDQAEVRLRARQWRRAAFTLGQIAKRNMRMHDEAFTSRAFLLRSITLFDGLGL